MDSALTVRMQLCVCVSTAAGISWLLLGLATVSASAIMFLSVQTRVPEIGLRRALGASRTATTSMFILEGLFIGTAGGLAGIAAGLTTVIMISATRDWIPVLAPTTIGIGVGIGAITGVVASIPPALRAATIDPAQAVGT
ncbi:FtsX-like permease family protein [Microbacteriaceae bacterium VKM Ac-2855]|nr:FtsX-like permease family protein [Microbacteriaceae bacterium VKM Ac-2855]